MHVLKKGRQKVNKLIIYFKNQNPTANTKLNDKNVKIFDIRNNIRMTTYYITTSIQYCTHPSLCWMAKREIKCARIGKEEMSSNYLHIWYAWVCRKSKICTNSIEINASLANHWCKINIKTLLFCIPASNNYKVKFKNVFTNNIKTFKCSGISFKKTITLC